MNKYQHVREAADGPAGDHHCHWPGCETLVPPAMWGCRPHWYSLPPGLRNRIWDAYVPGQEISKSPSEKYLKVALEAQDWIKHHLANPPPQHRCQWQGCSEVVKGTRWACTAHWKLLPCDLRLRVTETYQAGELKKTEGYNAVLAEIRGWIREQVQAAVSAVSAVSAAAREAERKANDPKELSLFEDPA